MRNEYFSQYLLLFLIVYEYIWEPTERTIDIFFLYPLAT